MPSITELLQNERTKGFLEVSQKLDSVKNYYSKNAIDEEVVVRWNEFNQKEKNPYAQVIAKEFDKMVENIIPKDKIISARFESWINKERNELIVDSKLNSDNYFKSWTDFETGRVFTRNKNEIIEAKGNYLGQELNRLEKSFVTHMQKSPEIAFADEKTLEKWANYYDKKQVEVRSFLEQSDYSSYDKKDKNDNIIKVGTEEDAVSHLQNIESRRLIVENSLNGKNEQNTTTNDNVDYVGNKVPFKQH